MRTNHEIDYKIIGSEMQCVEIELGCIKIKRDVQLEEKELEFTTTHQPNPINNDIV